jgi:rhomboid family GlyGly-CTERM serine protease
MGLFKRRQSVIEGFLADAAHWQVAVALIVICVAFALFGEEGRETFRYARLEVENGQYWRLLTGHFVHLGITHLLLNMAGLVLVWLLVGRHFTTLQWIMVVSVTLATQSFCFWFIDEFLLWYVGFSGVLHGLLLAGAIRGYKTMPSESVIITVIVIGKLAYEQLAGPLPGSESVSGGDVVVNAHLFGAIGGAIAVLLSALYNPAPDQQRRAP